MVSVSAVSGFDRVWGKLGRGIKMAPDFVLGTGNEVFSTALHDSFYGVKDSAGNVVKQGNHFKNLRTQIKQAALKSEKHNAAQVAAHGGFFKNMWYQLKTTPKFLRRSWKAGANKAGAKAGAGFLAKLGGGFKGSMKALGKRMPLIGALIMVVCELPNIVKRTKDEGLGGGIKETAKSAARLTGSMAGFAVGQALIPIPLVGGIIGAMIGDALTSLVVGKSYTEKKAKQEAELLAQQEAQMQAQQELMGQYQASNPFGGGYDFQGMGMDNPFLSSGMTLTPQQLQQMEIALRNGYGLNDNFDLLA